MLRVWHRLHSRLLHSQRFCTRSIRMRATLCTIGGGFIKSKCYKFGKGDAALWWSRAILEQSPPCDLWPHLLWSSGFFVLHQAGGKSTAPSCTYLVAQVRKRGENISTRRRSHMTRGLTFWTRDLQCQCIAQIFGKCADPLSRKYLLFNRKFISFISFQFIILDDIASIP